MLSLNNVRWATKALRIFTKSFLVDYLLFEFHVLSLSVHAVGKCHEIYIHRSKKKTAPRKSKKTSKCSSCWTCQWTRRRVSWNRTARDKGLAIAVMWWLCKFHGVTLFPLHIDAGDCLPLYNAKPRKLICCLRLPDAWTFHKSLPRAKIHPCVNICVYID